LPAVNNNATGAQANQTANGGVTAAPVISQAQGLDAT